MVKQLLKMFLIYIAGMSFCLNAHAQEPRYVFLHLRLVNAPIGWVAAMADRIEFFPSFIHPLKSGVFVVAPDRQIVRRIAADNMERLNQEIQRLELSGMGENIGTVRLITRDGMTASVEQFLGISYYDAPLPPAIIADALYKIAVTPHVLSGERVILSVQISEPSNGYNDWSELVDVLGEPIRDRPLHAVVLGRNGDTVMIGGVYRLTMKGLQRRLLYQWQRCVYEEHLIIEKTESLVKYIERYRREVLLFIKIHLTPQGWQPQTVT